MTRFSSALNFWLKVRSLISMVIGLISFAFCLPLSGLHAQTYQNIESNNIRIDPEWTARLDAGGFSWAFDLKIDKLGNCYSTGYFQRNLKLNDGYIEPKLNGEYFSGDTYFIAKHDKNGKFLWLRYATGKSRPAKIGIDSEGNIIVVGNLYGQKEVFTSTDTTTVTLDNPYDYSSGIFIAKYDTAGKLLRTNFFSEGQNEQSNDFIFDSKGNLCIAGNYQFRSYDNRSYVKNSYLLLKLSPDFELLNKLKGDTIGISTINSIFLDKNDNIYATGGFTNAIRLDKHEFRNKATYGMPFLAKFNRSFELEWAIDSLGLQRIGAGSSVVNDQKRNSYVTVNTSTHRQYFTKIDPTGNVVWIQTIHGQLDNANTSMLIDEKDNIYMAGEGYGAVFGANQPELLSFKSKGNNDFYLAKYNPKGELLWLKAGGAKGLDYCRSIALYKDDLFAFGWFGLDMEFFETVMKQGLSYTFWLAKFDHHKLETIDRNPQKMPERVAAAQREAAKFGVDKLSCGCTEPALAKVGYASRIKDLVEYSAFNKIIGWTQVAPENIYNHIYFRNYYFDNSWHASFNSLTAIAYQPIRMMHPDSTFALNLTPCTSESKFYELPLTLSYSHGIRQYERNFDDEAFDKTPKAYVVAFMSVLSGREDEILQGLLFAGEMPNIDGFAEALNSKYGTAVDLDSLDEEQAIEHILAELQRKEITFSDYILNDWLKPTAPTHQLNAQEKYRLDEIFGSVMSPDPVARLHEIIYPHVSASFRTKQIGIEISTDILRKWDGIKGQAAKGKSGEFLPPNILATIPELNYKTESGVEAAIQEVCFTRSEIAGTGILLTFNTARLLDGKGRHRYFPSIYWPYNSDYPRFIPLKVDSLIDNFTGLLIERATISMQLKGHQIQAEVNNLLINNRLIAGTITFPFVDNANQRLQSTTIRIKVDPTTTMEITTDEVAQIFTNLGFTEASFGLDGNVRKLFFSKYAD
jgi:hypothetical protein